MAYPDLQQNESLYDRNLAALRKRYYAIAVHLEKINAPHYREKLSYSGVPILEIELKNGRYVTLGDLQDPISTIARILPKHGDPEGIYLIFGMGLGYLLIEAAKKFPRAKFIVVESDPNVFKKALHSFDFTPYLNDHRFEFAVGLDLNILQRFYTGFFSRDNHHIKLAGISLIQDSSVTRLTREYYQKAAEILTQSVKDFWVRETGDDYRDTLIGLRHVLENVRELPRLYDMESFRDLFKNRPGIVVSAGPSLDENIEYLRAVQNHAVIVVADSALKKLLASGIKPFAVACLERDEVNAALFDGYDIPHDVVLFAPLLVRPRLIKNYPGPIATFWRNSYPFPWMPPLLNYQDAGVSCAHLAFHALELMGCREIGLVGQDLAYERHTGFSHHKDADQCAKDQFEPMEKTSVEDNQGTLISTNATWILFRNEFIQRIALNPHLNVYHVLHPSQGLKIPGTERTDPEKYFNLLRRNAEIPKQDVKKKCIFETSGKSDQYFKLLDDRVRESLALIEKSTVIFDCISQCAEVNDYIRRRDQYFAMFDPETRYLIQEILKPHQYRFEANAGVLWSPEELRIYLPDYVQMLRVIQHELMRELEIFLFNKVTA